MKTDTVESDDEVAGSGASGKVRAGSGSDARPTRRERAFSWARAMFYSHLWGGVLVSVLVLVISITGIMLNHKRGLGLMPEIEHSPQGAFSESLPLDRLADAAFTAAGITPDVKAIDRMDVRPRNGFVKIRFRDANSTEATVDLNSGEVLHLGTRGDVFLEKLHSGEIFGANGILLSDVAAVGLVLLIISGYWLWLKPRVR